MTAQVWNQPRADKPTYYISRTGYYLNQYLVNEEHNGWAISISPVFDDLEQAEHFLEGVSA